MNLLLAAAGVLTLALAGVGALRVVWPALRDIPRPARLALGYCTGCWLVTMIFFAAYLGGFAFSRRLIVGPIAVLALGGLATMVPGRFRVSVASLLPVCLCLLALAISWARPVYGYDAVMMWALKAKIAFFSHTWPDTMFDKFTTAHTEYPPLVPSAQAFVFFWLGQFDDVASRAVFAAFFASGAAILWWVLEGKWVWTLWWCALPVAMDQVKLAYADLPVAVYLLVFYGALVRWWKEPERRDWLVLAGLFGGMAFWVKQDALLGVGAAVAALVALKQFRAWPVLLSLLIALPWRLFTAAKHLPSDFALTWDGLPVKTAQVAGALWTYAIAGGGYSIFWPVFLLGLGLGYRRWRSIETRWLLCACVFALLGVFAVYWFSKPDVPALLQTSLERVLLNLFVPALLLVALLWPEQRAIAIVTIVVALFEIGQHARAWIDLRREFAGKPLAQQHVQNIEPELGRQIAGALERFPTGTHVHVLPKRSLGRHWFYYETYPNLIVDSSATNVIELSPQQR